jgi:hypothetical protein
MAGMGDIQGFDEDEDFYEDDEPVESVAAAYERGEKFVTAPPAVVLDTGGLAYSVAQTGGVHIAVTLNSVDFSAVRPVPVDSRVAA